jgi:glycosyltransferase involved in cell wall biosynthesis
VAQTYRSATQSGITQIAAHFEVPMVVTDVGGLPEMVPHGRAGYVVAPEPAAIAEAIADYFAHDRGDELRRGVREVKARYRWENMVNAFLEGHREVDQSRT